MQITESIVSISTKVNLGNYETADISISQTIKHAQAEDPDFNITHVMNNLRVKIAEEETKTKNDILARRGRLK